MHSIGSQTCSCWKWAPGEKEVDSREGWKFKLGQAEAQVVVRPAGIGARLVSDFQDPPLTVSGFGCGLHPLREEGSYGGEHDAKVRMQTG
jgi:hypothetical protein